jgi:hypothetical protein
MLQVFETAEASFRLSDGQGRDVGWIRGTAFGFGGFATEEEAIEAALVGSGALSAYLERSFGQPAATTVPGAPVSLVHDGAWEWVSRGMRPLARLHRPDPARALIDPRERSYRIEFVLPSYVRAGATIGAAQLVHREIARGGAAPRAVEGPRSADEMPDEFTAPAR